MYTVALSNRLSKTISTEIPSALIGTGLPATSVADFIAAITMGTPKVFAAVPGITDQITAAGLRAYKVASADAYRTVFLTTIAFLGLALVLSCLVPNVDDRMTDDVAAALHNRNDEKIVGP